jgi:hypothetical protein
MIKRWLVVLGLVAVPLVMLPATAGAQSAPITTPCPGCGPTPVTGPTGPWAWEYPEHICIPTNGGATVSSFDLVYGVGRNAGTTVRFQYKLGPVDGGSEWRTIPGIVRPGSGEHRLSDFVRIQPGQTLDLNVRAMRPNGTLLRFGEPVTVKVEELSCTCVQPTTSTQPATTAPAATTTVPSGSTTAPGSPTTAPTSVPAQSTVPTVAGTLPKTGEVSGNVATGGALLAFFGCLALLLAAKRQTVEA